ncbi:PREDICTED: uncharacterized protein LOC104598930 [Nelumbo nucifera]|uniref:Uncharacterized protein LOC104598930 n=1 Tax=Nelumbo nucifera TaxID=4432 RepID=A0A1U8A055_NELNU|nr:PREDICTED: uncharacterized protein LOC104598930 [Nelumbo nucifera]
MGCFAPTAAIVRLPLNYAFARKSNGGLRAKLNDNDNDAFLQAAITGASLRFQETHQPEPLLIDPYAGCFVAHDIKKDMTQYPFSITTPNHYCLATKFIDDKLLGAVNHVDGPRQVVLLTDGMDTRPYRLNWPSSTMIFDISQERVFQMAAQKLHGVGARIPKSCLFLHVPLESSDIPATLCRKGFNGNRPSIWAFQGLPLMTMAKFTEILFIVSSLAMKGCLFLGELPAWLVEAEVGIKTDKQKWMDKLFMCNGFKVDVVCYDEVARNMCRDIPSGDYKRILFVAEQLRFSDDQMENWRREFQRIEEEGDEDGFEEL